MADIHNIEKRSRNMSAVKSFNTQPEKYVRKMLFSLGFRYRLNQKKLPGSPDIVLAKYKTVIFINGCFWHRHTCERASTPKSNLDFWSKKFDSNVTRDKKNIETLITLGWKVIVIWECTLKGKFKIPDSSLSAIIQASILKHSNLLIEIEGNIS